MPKLPAAAPTSFRILHYTETAGFDHNTREQSAQMFRDIGGEENFTVDDTQGRGAFDDLTGLLAYEVIVFSNTSGNIPFTEEQRANLGNYIDGGGALLGIHAATDMYRNGSFPFYSNLIGGTRRNSPAHTANGFNGTMDVVGTHPSTTGLPDPWDKPEEYYYWPDTGLVDGITEVLRVRATGSNSYDAARPISWYQEFDSGARSFYTALGHARSNFTEANNDFRRHVQGALCWAVEAEAANLPVYLLDTRLEELAGGTHRIRWETGVYTPPSRVELHGGPTQTDTDLISAEGEVGYGDVGSQGFLDHLPESDKDPFYYRLRLYDYEGVPTWSPWLTAVGGPNLGVQVRYDGTEPFLFVPPATEVTTAYVVDAGGRNVGALDVREGRNVLPELRPGVYFVRLPFSKVALRFLVR